MIENNEIIKFNGVHFLLTNALKRIIKNMQLCIILRFNGNFIQNDFENKSNKTGNTFFPSELSPP
jgi:hypothetical protein